MIRRPSRRRLLQLLGAGALSTGLRPARAAEKLDGVTLTLDWRITGYHTPFFTGIDQKIFAKYGIDLAVSPGNGSRNTILAVAANNTMFGMADATALPAGVLQGADIKMFYIYQATTPFGIMFRKDSGITQPKDLEGKSYGDFPGSATYALFSAFAKKSGIDPAKVTIVNISPASQSSALIDRQVAAIFTAINDSYVTLTHRGYALDNFAYADHGLNLFSHGLIAATETLKNKDLVMRFAKAFADSVAAVAADPVAAATVTKRMVPAAPDIEVQIDMIKDTITNRLKNPHAAGKPTGWMAESDWASMIELLGEYGVLKGKIAPDRLFTNEYLTA
jgi:NitT/TauT family transport system substrate-binding protein